MSDCLDAVEIGPKDATASIIWLHGLGADGHDFEPIVPELALPESLRVRFVFPHAPLRPVTLNGGMKMPAWFDISALSREAPLDTEGFEATRREIIKLIERENARGVATENIVLAGFSQGGAAALGAALQYPEKLAGIMGLSTFLLRGETMQLEPSAANRDTSIFMAHGEQDPVVPLALGDESRQWLLDNGYSVEWQTYAMPHSVCMEEIADIRNWLLSVFESRVQRSIV